jgi:2-polyprenyl-6-methoxyphenol hydroxylase-like FAD-dependent oxidoreductase
MSAPIQLLIVGAGPTGLALACMCRRLGIRLRIVDQRAEAIHLQKAMSLQHRACELLACMGIQEELLSCPDAPTTATIHGKRSPLVVTLSPHGVPLSTGALPPRAIRIDQSKTEGMLREALNERGCAVEWSTQLVGFAQSEDSVSAHLQMPEGTEDIVHCKWLVSCEGVRGLASRLCGIRFESPTYTPMAFLIADVELQCSLSRETHHIWTHSDGVVVATPSDEPQRWRLFLDVTAQAASLPIDLTCHVLSTILRQRTGGAVSAVSELGWILPLNVDSRIAARFRHRRVLLAGDAAHFHSPTGGQGIVLGLEDAANLAWKLHRVLAGAPDRLLETYHEERRPQALQALEEIQRTLMLFTAPDWPLRALRDHVTIPALRRPGFQRHMLEPFTRFHASYRASRLSSHQDHRPFGTTKLHAGDRAPNVGLRRASGEATSLFQLLSGGKPLVLIGPGDFSRGDEAFVNRFFRLLDPLDIDAMLVARQSEPWWHHYDRCLIDIHDDIERLYGLQPPFLCLVRPDDHIGLIQMPINEAALRSYLLAICPGHRTDVASAGVLAGER